jgi:plastocyanin
MPLHDLLDRRRHRFTEKRRGWLGSSLHGEEDRRMREDVHDRSIRIGSRRWILATVTIAATLAVSACGSTPGASSPPSATTATSEAPASASAPASEAPASVEPSASASAATGGEVQDLAVTGTDFAFSAPTSIPAGITKITLTNDGAEEHQAQIAGLAAGTTIDDLNAALAGEEAAALALLTLSGGPTGVMPGDTGATTSNLAPGAYVFLCFVRSPDGVPHFAKGMIAPLEVTEPPVEAEVPAGDSEVTLQDFAFVGLDTLTPGAHTVTVTNVGPQPHEATIVELAEGVAAADLIPMFTSTEPPTGAPPFTSVGGVAGIAVGQTVTMDVDLEAGSYAFLCFVPDPATGAPHAALGMVGTLTVE